MLKFECYRFVHVCDWLLTVQLISDKPDKFQEICTHFADAAEECDRLGLVDIARRARRMKQSIENDYKDSPDAISALGGELHDDMLGAVKRLSFLRIRVEHSGFLDNPTLFGAEVAKKFNSAARDIQEAGNCLAADCCTGAVFHLMRAAEVALRALAKDRRITFPRGVLEQKQWGEILNQLEGVIGALNGQAAQNWPSEDVRQAQIRFYQGAMVEFRAFNDAWRRHVSHAHEGAMYDTKQAESILDHTRRFMQQLATKISDDQQTPEYWISA